MLVEGVGNDMHSWRLAQGRVGGVIKARDRFNQWVQHPYGRRMLLCTVPSFCIGRRCFQMKATRENGRGFRIDIGRLEWLRASTYEMSEDSNAHRIIREKLLRFAFPLISLPCPRSRSGIRILEQCRDADSPGPPNFSEAPRVRRGFSQ